MRSIRARSRSIIDASKIDTNGTEVDMDHDTRSALRIVLAAALAIALLVVAISAWFSVYTVSRKPGTMSSPQARTASTARTPSAAASR